jgi:hypothetical protein
VLFDEFNQTFSRAVTASRCETLCTAQFLKSYFPFALQIVAESFSPFLEEPICVGLLHNFEILIVPEAVS